MSLFSGPEVHAANPPETWTVVGSAGAWRVETAQGFILGTSHRTRAAALEAIAAGPERILYDKETRWYAGETVHPWRPYVEVAAEAERNRAHWAARARLASIRESIRAESVSWGELAELQGLAAFIRPDDLELLEWAGVPEHPED